SYNSVPLNKWSHVALVRSGSILRFLVNGVERSSTNIGSQDYEYSDYGVTIGSLPNIQESFTGYLDEVRITKGVARY
ncbi:LamG domain-containing protein, partial [bacterium]|nr:LamG domain-containing protein [bacterium]